MFFLITIIHLLSISEGHQCHEKKFRSILRGDYKDVIKLQGSSLIVSRKVNIFAGGFDNSVLIRDSIYYVTGGVGYTWCNQFQSIIIEMKQAYELNTLVIWLWDRSIRNYGIQVFASYNGVETIIFDTYASGGVVKIKFADQFVKQFRLYNRNGSTSNTQLHLIKIEAFYEL